MKTAESKSLDKSVIRILIIISAYIALLYIISLIKTPLIWLATAFFLALVIEPAVKWVQTNTPVKRRSWAIFVILLAIIAVVAIIAILVLPPLISQTVDFVHSYPRYIQDIQHSDSGLASFLNNHGVLERINLDSRQILDFLSSHRTQLIGSVGSIASAVTTTLTVLVLSLLVSLEMPQISTTFWRYQPLSKRRHRQQLAKQMHQTITGSVSGNLLTSLIAAIAASVFLTLLRIPYAIPLGIIIGLTDLIPMIGATLGAVIVTFATLIYTGPIKAIIVLVFFVVYQWVENNYLQPVVYQRTVNISPLVVMFSALCGVRLGGFVGALFAIPIAASIQIMIKDYLDNHRKLPNR